MNQVPDRPEGTQRLPALQAAGGLIFSALFRPNESASRRFVAFFTANIRNPKSRRAYGWAVVGLAAWYEQEARITALY